MRSVFLGIGLGLFTAFGVMAGQDANDRALIKAPSEWSSEERDSFAGTRGFLSLCRLYYQNGYSPGVQIVPFSSADTQIVEDEIRKRGLSDLDMSILAERQGRTYAIGQSFAGLVCELRRPVRLNKSFSVGGGHRWQAILPQQFVYFQGDGTSSGMLVTGWN
ncbi:hypothetical protein K7H20_13700 [Salipiger manganoxidans]|uniref:hypothetical protein n=1 Tax=Salipiger marinus TaxID=555512 RepID=UPI001E6345D1|nr:hypothetical protein [Salipiger manganoxidans]MCD1619119.1 hypothetical protein [Salipiger manganoxidans]